MSNSHIQIIEGDGPWQSAGTGAAGRSAGLADYLRVLVRYKRMIIFTVALFMLMAFVYVAIKAPVYRSDLTLQVEPNAPEYVAIKGVQNNADEDTFYQTQYNIIRSRAVAEKVVSQLSPQQAATLLYAPSWFAGLQSYPEQVDVAANREALVHSVRKRLSVHGLQDSQLVELQVTAPEEELSADLANMIADAYVSLQNQASVQITEQAHDWLTGQLDELRADLEASEKRLQTFKQQEGLLGSEDQENLTEGKLSGTSRKLLDANAERMAAQAQYEQMQSAREQGGVGALIPVLNNPVVQQLKLRQTEARRKLESLQTHYGSAAPKVQTAQAELSEITARLNAEIGNAVNSIEKRYQLAKQRQQDLEQSSQALSENVRELSGRQFELAKLEREVEINRNLFQTFLARVKETSLATGLNASSIRIIDDAVAPGAPIAPNAQRALGLALIMSLFLSVMLAFVRQNMNQTFRTPQDLENQLSLPGIGVLPKLTHRRRRDVLQQVSRQPRSPFAEAMGEIRTRLQVSQGEKYPQVIMVSSALPGEGKSTLSSNLASAYSQLGRTLLLDADLRKSSLAELGNAEGLTDFMLGKADSERCFAREKQGNLHVMSRGSREVNPQEFLSSAAMGEFFAKLREQFDTIIVDTAPVLAVSDALVLGRHVDGVILAVKAADTPFDVVHDAVRRLRSASINILGLTLSQVDLKELLRDGGYAYGHY